MCAHAPFFGHFVNRTRLSTQHILERTNTHPQHHPTIRHHVDMLLLCASHADKDVVDTSLASATASARGGSLHQTEHDEQQPQQQLQHLQRGSVVSAGDITVDDSITMGTQNALNTMRRGPSKHYLSGTCVLPLSLSISNFPIPHRFSEPLPREPLSLEHFYYIRFVVDSDSIMLS